jgi:hypothetical protein
VPQTPARLHRPGRQRTASRGPETEISQGSTEDQPLGPTRSRSTWRASRKAQDGQRPVSTSRSTRIATEPVRGPEIKDLQGVGRQRLSVGTALNPRGRDRSERRPALEDGFYKGRQRPRTDPRSCSQNDEGGSRQGRSSLDGRLVPRMPHGAQKKAQEDGPRGWTDAAPSRPRRASRRGRKWTPKLDENAPARPDVGPARRPRTGRKGSRKVGGSIPQNLWVPPDPQFLLGSSSRISVPVTPSRCIPSIGHSAHLRGFMTPPTCVASPPACRLASGTVRPDLRRPAGMLHPCGLRVV